LTVDVQLERWDVRQRKLNNGRVCFFIQTVIFSCLFRRTLPNRVKYPAVHTAHVPVRPARVAVRPARVAVRPARVAVRPARVTVRPARVAVRPARVAVRPARVAVRHARVQGSILLMSLLYFKIKSRRSENVPSIATRIVPYLDVSRHNWDDNTDMRRLTTAIRSEKCVIRRFHCCANVI